MSKEKKVPVAAFTKEQRQKMLTSIKETYERKGDTPSQRPTHRY